MNEKCEKNKSSLRGRKFLVLSLTLFALSIVFFAYAFTVTWNAPTTVTVYAASLDLKVYWDSACTNATTSINFGNVQKSTSKAMYMYIRNEGNGTVNACWNSTCQQVSSGITELWQYYVSGYGWYALNGTSIAVGTVLQTYYQISVGSNCTSGQYSWTLNLGAQPI